MSTRRPTEQLSRPPAPPSTPQSQVFPAVDADRRTAGGSSTGPVRDGGVGGSTADRSGGDAGDHRHRGRVARVLSGASADPRWARPALWAVLVLAGLLYGWNIASQTGNSYYSAAVLSGTQSWKAFFFGALDAGGYITVDKPPMALWAMSLTARLTGEVNGWSLIGPQAAMGVAAVAVLYATVRRVFGHAAALIAALVLALTPITVAINRDNNPDTLLVLLLVLAAWALQRALESGRTRWLVGCAVFVGLAFNTKMLQAYVVLPGFALVYLLFAPGRLRRRIGALLAAGVALVVSSAWWMVIVDLWPKGSRPYIGGSTDNSVWDLVVGYNGLGRILGASEGGGSAGGANFGGTAGLGRLFNETMGGQISWLLPFAAIALTVGVTLCGRAARTDPRRGALLLWGGWLAIHFLVFSLGEGGFHPYYTTAMAPAIGALVGAGTVMMFTARQSWARAVALPMAITGTGVWAIVLLNRTPEWNPWLVWVVGTACVLGSVGVMGASRRRRLGMAAVVIGLVGSLVGPAAYSATTAFSGGGGNGTNPTAGPVVAGSAMGGAGGRVGGSGPQGSGGPRSFDGTRPAPPTGVPSGAQGVPSNGGTAGSSGSDGMAGGPGGGVSSELVSYLVNHRGSATWLVAVGSAQSASSIILETGEPVIAMGGFTGSDPAMTLAKLKEYFESGKLKYIIVGDDNRGANSEITEWVKDNLTAVDADTYGGSSSGSSGSSGSGGSNSSGVGSDTADSADRASDSGVTLYRYDG